MIYVENDSKSTIILNAFKCSTIRLFPGYNEIDVENEDDLAPYFQSKANAALLNGYNKSIIDYNKKDEKVHTPDNYNQNRKDIWVKPVIKFINNIGDSAKIDTSKRSEYNKYLNKDRLNITDHIKKDDKSEKRIKDQQKEISDLKSIMLNKQQEFDEMKSMILEMKKQMEPSKSKSNK